MIRGVNIGGWLVLERYITPYQFAITECHLEGNLCWYPGAISRPKQQDGLFANLFDSKTCSKECMERPVLIDNIFDANDYPLDEWNLAQVFHQNSTAEIGESWLNYHFDNFVTYEDLKQVKQSGITHIRVPLPHWILQHHDSSHEYRELYSHLQQTEPYLVGNRWKYFVRLCLWARKLGLQVWPNIHTAPGSQNGFDNSGQQSSNKTCVGWMEGKFTSSSNTTTKTLPANVDRSLQVIDHVTNQIAQARLQDVVTGFGLLNEPYIDCDIDLYKKFMDDGLDLVRQNLGQDVGVFVSDAFWAPQFNDGEWWLDPDKYHDTYLDSHYYTVFTNYERHMSPQDHIRHICQPPAAKGLSILDCCHEDPHHSNTTHPSKGVGRIVTEWSVAYDSMPGELLKIILQGIRKNGIAPLWNRTLSTQRKEFMRQYAQAQMVSFEQNGSDLGKGWFFWTLKVEGGAYLEWDFLRSLDDDENGLVGWFPKLPQNANTPSEELYGSCQDIIDEAAHVNASEVVRVYPWGDETAYKYWDPTGLGWLFDHEQSLSKNGSSVLSKTNITVNKTTLNSISDTHHNPEERIRHSFVVWFEIAVVALLAALIVYGLRKGWASPRYWKYIPIKDHNDNGNDDGDIEHASYGATIDLNRSNGNHAATLQV